MDENDDIIQGSIFKKVFSNSIFEKAGLAKTTMPLSPFDYIRQLYGGTPVVFEGKNYLVWKREDEIVIARTESLYDDIHIEEVQNKLADWQKKAIINLVIRGKF